MSFGESIGDGVANPQVPVDPGAILDTTQTDAGLETVRVALRAAYEANNLSRVEAARVMGLAESMGTMGTTTTSQVAEIAYEQCLISYDQYAYLTGFIPTV
jgi:hypothetical protein